MRGTSEYAGPWPFVSMDGRVTNAARLARPQGPRAQKLAPRAYGGFNFGPRGD